MKVFWSALAIVAFAMVQPIYAQTGAAPNVIITADENGVGTLDFIGGGQYSMPGIPTPDGLFYNMQGPPFLTPGDLLMMEPATPPATQVIVSDIIRFGSLLQPGPVGIPVYGFYFYSDKNDGIDNPADIMGLPTVLLPDRAVIPEGALYIPDPNQPGFVPGFVVEYKFNSDVPDGGATVGLLGMGLCGLMALARRFKK